MELVGSTTQQRTGCSTVYNIAACWSSFGILKLLILTNINHFFSSSTARVAYLGLTLSLRTISFIICIPGFILLSHQLQKERNGIHGALANGGAELEALRKEDFVISSLDQSQHTSDNSTDRETQL